MYSPSDQMLKEYVEILNDVAKEDGFVDAYEEALVQFVSSTMSRKQCEARGINNRVFQISYS